MLSSLVNEQVGVKWRPIRTNDRFRKDSIAGPSESVNAMHIESAANKASEIRQKLLKWCSSSSKFFPDGTKMRLVPPFHWSLSLRIKRNIQHLLPARLLSQPKLAPPLVMNSLQT